MSGFCSEGLTPSPNKPWFLHVCSKSQSPTRAIFFPRIDDSRCDRIHSSLTAVRCFNNSYVGKQPVAWREYYAEYLLKELQEKTDRCTGHCNITEILLETALNTVQLITQPGLHLFK